MNMFNNIFKKDNIKLDVEVSNWHEAIRAAGEILLKEGKIEKNYIDNMIEVVEKLGPYIVITPGIAFAHAKPGEYVKEECMSIIRLKEGINFGCENDPVSLMIAFAACSNDEHMNFIMELVTFLNVKENIELLNECNDTEEIYNKIIGKFDI